MAKVWNVVFHYTVEVFAEDEDDAEDEGFREFQRQFLDGITPGDFSQSEPEMVGEDD